MADVLGSKTSLFCQLQATGTRQSLELQSQKNWYCITLIQEIRALQKGKPIPAIAITAYAGDRDQQKTLATGFQRHIAKPVAPNTLIEAITSLLAQRK